ncbi:MAG: tetratricopeptide repeat protein, partial [Deltaproteobacteria bacterium]|nr:tetratricopeptide repeat protein [Deltaproteobacteria bacterium]
TQGSAQKALSSLRNSFHDAWVSRVSAEERGKSVQTIVLFKAPVARVADKPRIKIRKKIAALLKKRPDDEREKETPEEAQPGPASEKQLAAISAMMKEAEVAMTSGNYSKAIKLYKRVLHSQPNPYQQSAREFIGLAYEKRGQVDQAIAEYKGYLILYPKSKEAIRVRQRLAGLETARARPMKKLKKVKRRRREGTEFYGGFSQFYNRDESYTDLGGKSISRSSLSSDLDLNIRKRGRAYDIRSVFIGGYDYNFIDDGTDNDFRLN